MPRETPPSERIVQAVAEREGVDETSLPHLAETIDPDALDALYSHAPSGTSSSPAHVRFTYCDYTIVVDDEHTVTID